jgi:16S rRNA (guanine966-N2)-methyltransferase
MVKMPNPKLRIIAGKLKNQPYFAPGTLMTHPMSERLKGALFNTLGDIGGLSVLDAFSGSGGIGLEAASRGAGSVTFIESDQSAQKTIAANIRKLGLDDLTHPLRMSLQTWLKTKPEARFNIIIADPPYDKIQTLLLEGLAKLTAAGGIFVVSLPSALPAPNFPDLELVTNKSYGNSRLVFYRKSLAQ